jgi:hypothetical protein
MAQRMEAGERRKANVEPTQSEGAERSLEKRERNSIVIKKGRET